MQSSFSGNLSPRGIRARQLGSVLCLVCVLILLWMRRFGYLPGSAGWCVAGPMFGAVLTWMQAREKTCVALSAQGLCEGKDGICPIAPQSASQARKLGLSILLRSLALAALLTLAALFFTPLPT